ncbi:hypothetical protein BH09BAC5_BH09BAC5_06570 [soil metagenome]
MRVIRCDVEIFDLLEKAGLAQFDTTRSQVFDFTFEDFWHLLIFSRHEIFTGCTLFVIEKQNLFSELQQELIPALLNIEAGPENEELLTDSLMLIEQLLIMKSNEYCYFDGH